MIGQWPYFGSEPWGKDRVVVGFNDHYYVLPSQICVSRASVDIISSERDRVTLHIS